MRTPDTLVRLRSANAERHQEWSKGQPVSLAFRGVELAGEVGELCNLLKKLERERLGWVGSRASLDEVRAELADVIICVDLIALDLGVDLTAVIPTKFNQTSEKNGHKTRMQP